MANTTPQSFANHTRLDPGFHFFLLPLGLAAIVLSVIWIIRHPSIGSALGVVLAIGFVMIAEKARSYVLRVQDRVIRLEERLRLQALAPQEWHAQIYRLSESQLIALRFAGDDEVVELAKQALEHNLNRKQIKERIKSWRSDEWRV